MEVEQSVGTVITIVFFLIGLLVAIAGIYYLIQEKNDLESRKIYLIVSVIGILIILATAIKIFVWGF